MRLEPPKSLFDSKIKKSNAAMNVLKKSAIYPYSNFSGTSSTKFRGTKALI